MIKTTASSQTDRWLVPLSLVGSFALNDGEELLTMARVPAGTSWVPSGGAASRHLPQSHVNVAIGWMGLMVVAAAVDGVRTECKGRLFQDVQLVFGAHGLVHLVASMRVRGYTTGVITAPVVVLQWWWAGMSLRRSRVPQVAHPLRASAVMGAWLATAHALGAYASQRP